MKNLQAMRNIQVQKRGTNNMGVEGASTFVCLGGEQGKADQPENIVETILVENNLKHEA